MRAAYVMSAVLLLGQSTSAQQPLDFTVKLETVLEHDDGKFLWFHPRVAVIPGAGKEGKPAVLMSRCTDETGYVQPTREELVAARGLNATDHYNGIKSWFVKADGTVSHV